MCDGDVWERPRHGGYRLTVATGHELKALYGHFAYDSASDFTRRSGFLSVNHKALPAVSSSQNRAL